MIPPLSLTHSSGVTAAGRYRLTRGRTAPLRDHVDDVQQEVGLGGATSVLGTGEQVASAPDEALAATVEQVLLERELTEDETQQWMSEAFDHWGRRGVGPEPTERQTTGRRKATLQERADRLRTCCTQGAVWVPLDRPAGAKWCPYRCDDRFCRRDHWHRTRKLRSKAERWLAEAVKRRRYIRFITLTLGERGRFTSAGHAYDFALRAMRKLRNSAQWGARVDAALQTFEVTVGPDGYHPHLHIIYVGKFWGHEELRHQWSVLTGASIVHIKAVHTPGTGAQRGMSPDQAVTEMVKPLVGYDTKPGVSASGASGRKDRPWWREHAPDSEVGRLFAAAAADLHGRRLHRTTGSWYGAGADDTGEAEAGDFLGYKTLVELAAWGREAKTRIWARTAMRALRVEAGFRQRPDEPCPVAFPG